MRDKQIVTFLILSFMFLLSIAEVASAQTVNVGITQGAVFTYNYSLTWSSTDSTQSIPSEFEELSKISSIEIRITEITDSTINTEITTYFKDGSSKNETGYVDVSSGAIRMPYGYLIARADMNANEKIYPFGNEATINDTTQRTYTTGQRETCHRLVEISQPNYYEKTEIFYDKQLGIAVDYMFESQDTSGAYTTTFTETLTNANSDVWAVIPEFPMLLIPFLLVGATTLILLATKKKNYFKPL